MKWEDRPLGAKVKVLDNKLSKMYNDVLRPYEITFTQYIVLAILRENPYAHLSAVAKYVGCDRTTLSRGFKLLDKGGYMQYSPGVITRTSDNRLTKVVLTDKGKNVVDKCRKIVEELDKNIQGRLSRNGWDGKVIVKMEELKMLSEVLEVGNE